MAKKNMFLYFNGSVADFKQKNLTDYANSIVFITGSDADKTSAIYARGKFYGNLDEAGIALKYFSSISDGTSTATAQAPNTPLVFKGVNDHITVSVGAEGVKVDLADSFVTAVNAKATTAQFNELDGAYKKADQELDKRIGVLELAVGDNGSVADKIKAAIDALDVAVSEGDYVKTIKQEDGKIVATTGTFNFDASGSAAQALADAKVYADGLAKNYDAAGSAANAEQNAKNYADGLAVNYDAAGSASTAEQNAKNYVDGKVQEINGAAASLEGRVKANEDAIVVINGEGDGSIKKAVADGIASVVANADQDFDTLKEVADWIKNDTIGAADMQNAINRLDGADTVEGSVKKQVKDAVAAEAAIARAAEKANADAIDAIEADYLKAEHKTALEGLISAEQSRAEGIEGGLETRLAAVEADYLKASDQTALQGSITELSNTVAANKTAAETGISEAKASASQANNAIADMDLAEVSGYITKVSQVDGKVAASAVANIPAADISVADVADVMAATNVEAALKELVDMWSWAEA